MGFDAEVAVIGCGTVGSMTLWQLADRGIDVVGFEAYAPGHDRGAAGGETRLFRMAYAEGSAFAGLLSEARELWRELERVSGASLLQQIGGLSIGDPAGAYLRGLLDSARASRIEVESVGADEAQRRWPQHALLPGEIVVHDPSAGFVRSDLAVVVATDRARQQGARVQRYAPVQDFTADERGVSIRTRDGVWRVRTAVITAGSWSAHFLPGLELAPRRVPLSWFSPLDPGLWGPDRFPVFIRESEGVHLYGAPAVDGGAVKVAGAVRARDITDPDAVQRRHDTWETEVMVDAVTRFLPGLRPDPIRADAYTDLYTPDAMPVVGPVPGLPGVFCATGFSGKGFKMAPAIGNAVAELVTGGRARLPESFAPTSRHRRGASAAPPR